MAKPWPYLWGVMSRIISAGRILFLLLLFGVQAVPALASTIIYPLTNFIPGQVATNAIRITPVGPVQSDGSYFYTGIAKPWLTGTTNGLYTNQLNGGNYEAFIQMPNGVFGVSNRILFQVPFNDTNTWTLPQLQISGGNFFVTRIVNVTNAGGGTNVANIVSGPGVVGTTNGLAITIQTNGALSGNGVSVTNLNILSLRFVGTFGGANLGTWAFVYDTNRDALVLTNMSADPFPHFEISGPNLNVTATNAPSSFNGGISTDTIGNGLTTDVHIYGSIFEDGIVYGDTPVELNHDRRGLEGQPFLIIHDGDTLAEQVWTNDATHASASVTTNCVFVGNGSGLTLLPAANLAGTVPDARLSANVALYNNPGTFSGTQTFNNTTNTGSLDVAGQITAWNSLSLKSANGLAVWSLDTTGGSVGDLITTFLDAFGSPYVAMRFEKATGNIDLIPDAAHGGVVNISGTISAKQYLGVKQTLSGTSIDWSTGTDFLKVISGNTTFTFANAADTEQIQVVVSNTASYTVTWPAGVSWQNQATPTQTANRKDIYTFKQEFGVIHGTVITNF